MTRRLGRYELLQEIGAGGMATVHLARVVGRGGFSRLVAVKVCDPLLSADDVFVRMFLDEARLAAGIHHPNVVATLDVCEEDTLFLVMEYVEGGRLADLLRDGTPLSPGVAIRILCDALGGLHAAHELAGADGRPLGLVHRDVSPHNVLVGTDGVARIADFGVAKAEARLAATAHGARKGKVAYMAPEQYRSGEVTRRSDVFAAAVVLWEALTGRRLFEADAKADLVHQLLFARIAAPSSVRSEVPAALDAPVLCALSRDPTERFETALAFAEALEGSGVAVARPKAVEEEVLRRLGETIAARRALVRSLEATPPETAPERRKSGAHALEPPTVAGIATDRFEIRERIGAGGTAIVFRAFDKLLRREVALKRIENAGDESLGGFVLREGRTAAALDHPNVVRIHDVDPEARILVMELVRGESLERRLAREGALGLQEALRLGREILRGLSAAHRLGVLHLDLKPSNVLCDEDGVAKVADFGLAAAVAAATIQGPVGTLPYMAPEQRLGSTALDARTDVYGFGLVLFEMVCGRRFETEAETPADAEAATIAAGRSADLAAIVSRCLAPDPDRRWPSADALLSALEEVARGISSRGISVGARLPFEDDGHPHAKDVRRAALRIYALDDLAADSELTALVTEDPEHAAAAYYLALGRGFALSPAAEALAAAEAALALEQPAPRRAILEAIAAFAKGDHEGARRAVDAESAQHPDDWELSYARGEALVHAGEPEAGNRCFERSVSLAPHMLLGHIHAVDFALARGDEAMLQRWLDAFAQSEAKPEYGPAYRAFYETWKGNPRAALEHLGHADGPNATQARIGALVLTGNLEEARRAAGEDARSYWRGDPRTPDALALAWLCHLQGKKDEWERWMARARKQADDGRRDSAAWVYGQQSMAYAMTGELDRARTTLAHAREVASPGARSVPFATAMLAWLEGRTDPIEPAHTPWPSDLLAIAGLAEATAGRADAALPLLRRALLEAVDTWLLAPTAWCLAKLSRDRDRATWELACDYVLHPRRVHPVWAYALEVCRE